MVRTKTADRVWLTGTVIGGVFLLAGDFLQFKANRLVSGEGVSLWRSDPLFFSGILFMWILLLAGGMVSNARLKKGAALIGVGLLLALLFLAGHLSSSILSGEPEFARVSLGSGFWGSLFGIFMVLIHAGKTLPASRFRTLMGALLLLGVLLITLSGVLDSLSLVREFFTREDRFYGEFLDHLKITFLSVGASTAVGLPLGVALIRIRSLQRPVFSILNTVQTVPSLALFGLLIAPLALLSEKFE
ncbi:MAG: ABC transporter permease, partial [Desulfovibrionales bacterium]